MKIKKDKFGKPKSASSDDYSLSGEDGEYVVTFNDRKIRTKDNVLIIIKKYFAAETEASGTRRRPGQKKRKTGVSNKDLYGMVIAYNKATNIVDTWWTDNVYQEEKLTFYYYRKN